MTFKQAKKDFEILILYVKDAENNLKSVEWLPDDAEGKIAVTAEHWFGVKSQPLLCFVTDKEPTVG